MEDLTIKCDSKRERLEVLYKALDHDQECENRLLNIIRKQKYANEKEHAIIKKSYNEQQYQRRKIERQIERLQEDINGK